ncbi:hypothetical protein [Peribacillus muralis]|uniref:hypothetical protein n=1 Tax=Peribacillus muralis TaxID=264697 RepID=UPI003D2D9EBE
MERKARHRSLRLEAHGPPLDKGAPATVQVHPLHNCGHKRYYQRIHAESRSTPTSMKGNSID